MSRIVKRVYRASFTDGSIWYEGSSKSEMRERCADVILPLTYDTCELVEEWTPWRIFDDRS